MGDLREGLDPPSLASSALLAELEAALAPSITVIKQLGSGGMGAVFLGRDPALKRLVAIKVLDPGLAKDPGAAKRFAREAEAAAAVEHPNVVGIYHVGTLPQSACPYFVMRFIDGVTLGEAFTRDRPVSMPEARRIVADVASALAAAHSKGVIHRDIKPANVMLERDTHRTTVLDFGISAVTQEQRPAIEPRLTQSGTYIGTPMYMSPEQAAAEPVTPKSDVYALGVMAFELVAGEPPFHGRSALELIAAHVKETPRSVRTLRSDVDLQFADLIDSCLAKNPVARPTAEDVARSLQTSVATSVEWPPPGLDALRASGTQLTNAIGASAVLGWLLLAGLLLQPTTARPCCWLLSEENDAFRILQRVLRALHPFNPDFREGDFASILAVLLVGGFAIVPVVWGLVARQAWRFGRHVRSARLAEYPWATVFAVAWDSRADTELLINGLGPYGVLSPHDRRKYLRLRTRAHLAALGALAMSLVIPLLWGLGVFDFWPDGTDATLPLRESVILIAIPLAMLIWSYALNRPESRFLRGSVARRTSRAAEAQVRGEVVARWLRDAGVMPAPAHWRIPRALFPLVAAIAVTPLFVAGLLALGATLLAGTRITDGRKALQRVNLQDQETAWRLLSRATSRVARVTISDPSAGSIVPVRFLSSAVLSRGGWAVDSTIVAGVVADTAVDMELIERSRRAVMQPQSVRDPQFRSTLERDTSGASLHYWRAFAQANSPPAVWYRRRDASIGAREVTLPLRTLGGPEMRNVIAAALLWDSGNHAAAKERLRENFAVAWRFANDPHPAASQLGWNRYLNATTWMLMFGRSRGDSSLQDEAGAISSLVRDAWPTFGGLASFANPQVASGLRWVHDPDLRPGLRWLLIGSIRWSYCTNAREILFGIDPARRELLGKAERLASDIPRVHEWAESERTLLDAWIDNPVRAARLEGVEPKQLFRIPAFLGLGHAGSRLYACLRQAGAS